MSWKHYSMINRCIRAMPLGKQASLCRGDSETDHKVTRHTMQQVSSTVDGNHLAWTMSIWKEDEHSSFGWQFSTGVQTFSGQPKFYGSQLDEWAQINVAQLQQQPQPQQPQENAVSLLTYCLPTCSIFFLSAGPLPSLPSTTRVFISHLSLHPDCHNLQSHWHAGPAHPVLVQCELTITRFLTLWLGFFVEAQERNTQTQVSCKQSSPYSMLSNAPFLLSEEEKLLWKAAAFISKPCATVASCSIVNWTAFLTLQRFQFS